MSITNFAASKILNHDFNGAEYTHPATWHVGFRKNGVELSGNGYARVAKTSNTTNWPTTTTNIISNGTAIETPVATGGDWNEADEVVLYDAASGGNLWYWDQLDAPFTVRNGDKRTFPIGALQIKMI